MVSKTITVISGLESRPAALFVQNAGRFASKIMISVDDKSVNAKSIMGVISLGITDNQQVTITADGDDEDLAVSELIHFLSEAHPE